MKYRSRATFFQIKSSVAEKLSQCKLRLLIFAAVVLACFIAGIVVYCASPAYFPAGENILSLSGVKAGFGAFFSRCLSLVIVMGICFASSLTPFTLPFGIIVLGFRGYLLGFNICALCEGFGMGGLIQAIVIIIPCQMCMLAALIAFFALISKANSTCKKFGTRSAARGKIFLIMLAILLVLNILETALLSIFSAKVILVI